MMMAHLWCISMMNSKLMSKWVTLHLFAHHLHHLVFNSSKMLTLSFLSFSFLQAVNEFEKHEMHMHIQLVFSWEENDSKTIISYFAKDMKFHSQFLSSFQLSLFISKIFLSLKESSSIREFIRWKLTTQFKIDAN